MLNAQTERDTDKKVMLTEEISTSVLSGNPFENRDDLVLLGRIASLTKGKIELRSGLISVSALKSSKYGEGVVSNQIEKARQALSKSPENPHLLNNLGLSYLANDALDNAMDCFRHALSNDKALTNAALNLAIVYLRKNQEDEAIAIYRDILNTNSSEARASINLGTILLRKRDIGAAREMFENVLEDEPNNLSARNRLALVELIDGKPNKAIKELRNCIRQDPSVAAFYNNLGVTFGASRMFEKAIESLKVAIKLNPAYSQAVSNMAKVLKQVGEIKKAINLLDEYSRTKPDAELSEILAELYLEDKEYAKSLRILRNLITSGTNSGVSDREISRLINNAAVVYHRMGDIDKAETFYTLSIDKSRLELAIPLINIVDFYLSLRKLSPAKRYIEILQAKFPNEKLVSYYSAVYAYCTDDIREAFSRMEAFLASNSDFAPAYSFMAFLCSEYLDDYETALTWVSRGLETFPRDITLLNNLAYNYLMLNRIESAKSVLDQLNESQDDVFLTATRGLLEIKQGNFTKGRELYNKASRIANSVFLKNEILQKKELELGRFYIENGKSDIGKNHLERVLADGSHESIFKKQAQRIYEKLP